MCGVPVRFDRSQDSCPVWKQKCIANIEKNKPPLSHEPILPTQVVRVPHFWPVLPEVGIFRKCAPIRKRANMIGKALAYAGSPIDRASRSRYIIETRISFLP